MPSQKMRCYMIEEKAMSVLSRKDLTTAYNASILAQHSTAQHSTAVEVCPFVEQLYKECITA